MEPEDFVKAALPNVGDVILYPTLLDNAQKALVDARRMWNAKEALRTSGWLREEIAFNAQTKSVEHRVIRVGS